MLKNLQKRTEREKIDKNYRKMAKNYQKRMKKKTGKRVRKIDKSGKRENFKDCLSQINLNHCQL